jgi:hypothetical protein
MGPLEAILFLVILLLLVEVQVAPMETQQGGQADLADLGAGAVIPNRLVMALAALALLAKEIMVVLAQQLVAKTVLVEVAAPAV